MINGLLGGDSSVVLGEVHTGLLQSSTALPTASCVDILSLISGERVRRHERPISYTVSPDLLVGVDCRLATASGTKARGVGTVACRASITGGHVLQASSTVQVARSEHDRRLPWSYYLARPGRVEAIGRTEQWDLASGFLASKSSGPTLDLGAVSTRVVDGVQHSWQLDQRAPFRAARTRLRWAAVTATPEPDDVPRLTVEKGNLRTFVVSCGTDDLETISGFCEDLALHDWLLTTLLHLIERSRIGIDPQLEVVNRLRPAVQHLLHLWMPAARMDQTTAALWESLERRPGLGRQWRTAENRIRDQLALAAISLLGDRFELSTR
jgi:hypothetical protein